MHRKAGYAMAILRRVSAFLGVGVWISAVAVAQPHKPGVPGGAAVSPRAAGGAPAAYVPKPFLTASVVPKQFGTQDHTITVLSATQFSGVHSGIDPATLSLVPNLCLGCGGVVWHYYTALDLPAGAVIDYIGVNTATTVDAALGFTLHRRNLSGVTPIASFSIPAHAGFATDYTAGPLDILIPANADRAYVLDLEYPNPGLVPQYFGFVEIWWRRAVSDPPATPTFGDVPASHPFYQFIEALAKSGITSGCGGGSYCPDNPLTRGQMAVFLSKALGLHWPY
jgi:S-layer homology domain